MSSCSIPRATSSASPSRTVQAVELQILGEVWHWRGPSPYHFVTLPANAADAIRSLSSAVTYGWGVVPVRAEIGATIWRTSLIPKAGSYLAAARLGEKSREARGRRSCGRSPGHR